MLRSPKTNQIKERVLSFEVDGTATASITIGSGLATLTDNGPGDYTLTFNRRFARRPVATCTTQTDITTCRIKTKSETAITIETLGADQTTPQDAIFDLIVRGWDTDTEYDQR